MLAHPPQADSAQAPARGEWYEKVRIECSLNARSRGQPAHLRGDYEVEEQGEEGQEEEAGQRGASAEEGWAFSCCPHALRSSSSCSPTVGHFALPD